MPDGIDDLRRGLRERLPDRLQTALDGYARFTAEAPPSDSKGFAAWHAAAKVALAHVESALKLLHWAEGEAAAGDPAADGLAAMVSQARDAIDCLEETEDL